VYRLVLFIIIVVVIVINLLSSMYNHVHYKLLSYYRAIRMHGADYAVASPPVHLSDTRRYCVETAKYIITIFTVG